MMLFPLVNRKKPMLYIQYLIFSTVAKVYRQLESARMSSKRNNPLCLQSLILIVARVYLICRSKHVDSFHDKQSDLLIDMDMNTEGTPQQFDFVEIYSQLTERCFVALLNSLIATNNALLNLLSPKKSLLVQCRENRFVKCR